MGAFDPNNCFTAFAERAINFQSSLVDDVELTLVQHRKMLRNAGYKPIPISGKIPALVGWQKQFNCSDRDIEAWEEACPHATNTGLLTATMPTFDVDLANAKACNAVKMRMRGRYANRGQVLVRVGNPPKFAIPFRTEVSFKKIVVNLVSPDGSKGEKIEVLCDGQQVAAFGIHPETRRQYHWSYGAPGEIPFNELPAITVAEAQELVSEIVDLLVHEFGYQRASERTRDVNEKHVGGVADWKSHIQNVCSGKNYHDSLRDLAAKFITSGMNPGAAVNSLRAIMEASVVPRDARWKERYDDIPRLVESAEKFSQKPDVVTPVDLWGHFEPPTLPNGLLPKVIEEYARVMGETMGVDPGGLAMAALAACSGATPDVIKLRMKRHNDQWHESSRIWVGLIGLPSTKKSPIISSATRKIVEIDYQLLRQYQNEQAQYNELQKGERTGVAPPVQKRIRLEDTTIEGAQEVLVGSPNGVLLLRDELSGWFGGMDRYSGGSRSASMDRGFWLQAYNGGQYAWSRVGRRSGIIPNLSVSLLGGIQPDTIRRLAAESLDDGLLQRLIPIVLSTASTGRDVPMPPVAKNYEDLIEQLTELSPPPKSTWNRTEEAEVLRFDKRAQELRDELEEKHHALLAYETVNGKLASHFGKYDGLFGRLCALWHCIEHAHEAALPADVTYDTARRVADFMGQFLQPHALAFYSGVLGLADDHDRLAAVAGYILAHKLDRVTNRDIARGDRTMRGLKARDTDAVFEQLEALGWVSRTPGPRSTHWAVNSQVHLLFAARAAKEAERRAATRRLIADGVCARQGLV